MDDFFKSVSTVTDLINLSKWIISILQPYGFRQVKWNSNFPEILHFHRTSKISTHIVSLDFNTLSVERAIRMIKNINPDTLT